MEACHEGGGQLVAQFFDGLRTMRQEERVATGSRIATHFTQHFKILNDKNTVMQQVRLDAWCTDKRRWLVPSDVSDQLAWVMSSRSMTSWGPVPGTCAENSDTVV